MPNSETQLEPLAMHQTVIVPPARLAPLFILTVPKHDVTEEEEPIWDTIADLLGSAGPPMTLERWAEILRRVEPDLRELTRWWEEAWHSWPPLRHDPRFRHWYREEIPMLMSRLNSCAESPQFGRGLVEGLLSGSGLPFQTPFLRRAFPWPFWPSPIWALADAVYARRQEIELSEGEATTFAFIANVLAADKSQRVRATLESISDFDVPFALSRRSDKTTLSSIVSEARMVAFFPIAPGAVLAAHHISQGSYVVGLEIAAVSGATTLILAATYSLAERLLRLGRRRGRRRQ